MNSKITLLALAGSACLVSACIPLAFVAGGVATGAYMGAQERGAEATLIDTKIKTHIKDRLTNMHYTYLTDVGVNVLQGDALLTGVVATDSNIREIVERVRGVPDVKNVYNELFSGTYSSQEYAKDSWISTQLKARMLGTKEVYSINYLTDVVKGHVYIMGLAQSQAELDRVLYVARTTKGVSQVHNYIRLASGSANIATIPEAAVAPAPKASNPAVYGAEERVPADYWNYDYVRDKFNDVQVAPADPMAY